MSKAKVYFENLDALRGLAFLMVFLWHIFSYLNYTPNFLAGKVLYYSIADKGHLGVNLFFVLSGFLITYLLLLEKERLGKINIWFFYIRRALRIWPLYFLVITFSLFLLPWLTHQFSASAIKEHLLYFVFFISNFDRINTGFVGIGNDTLGTFWSIAVEEQFYLFWPIFLAVIPKSFYQVLFYAVILSSIVFRYVNLNNSAILYAHTLSVMSDLAVGGLLAHSAIYKTKLFYLLENCKTYMIILMYGLLMFLIVFYHQWSNYNNFLLLNEKLMLSLFFAFVIGEQCFGKYSFYKLHRLKYLSKLGIISFGLYCYHLFSVVIIQKVNVVLGLNSQTTFVFYSELLVCFLISYFFAYFSYNFFEKRILALKVKFISVETR